MRIGGTPGLSLGVVTNGKPVYHRNYGYRDLEATLPVTEDIIFPTGSLTKALTAASIAILVDEKKATWDTLVKDVLPTFQSKDETLQSCLTLTDILCHRHGMARGDNLVMGTDSNILVSGQNAMRYINNQSRSLPFRGQFTYSNTAYDLAGKVIESLSGQSYRDFVKSRILEPLGMDRSFLQTPPPGTPNVSECYNALDDSSTAPISCPKAGDNGYMGSTAGLRSCVNDLMKLYAAFVTSLNEQPSPGDKATLESPLKQVTELMFAKVPLDPLSSNETSYALGWARVQLPGQMGHIGLNPDLLPTGMPVIGREIPPELVLFHQGSMPGVLSSAILLPRTESAIVVLTNSLALTDVADWVGQLVLEELLGVPEPARPDLIRFAEMTIEQNLQWYPSTIKQLEEERVHGTSPKDLRQFVGTHWDDVRVFKIVVTLEDGILYWAFQGLDTEKFPLTHYANDTFTWIQPRNGLSRRGRWVGVDQVAAFWKVEFSDKEAGVVDRLYWAHDDDVLPTEFRKDVRGLRSE